MFSKSDWYKILSKEDVKEVWIDSLWQNPCGFKKAPLTKINDATKVWARHEDIQLIFKILVMPV